jgi:hypothetical protein
MKTFVKLIPGLMVLWLILHTCWSLYFRPDYNAWPAITRCRQCEERIWAWQSHQEVDYQTTCHDPDDLGLVGVVHGLVHENCVEPPILFAFTFRENGSGQVRLEGLTLRPKEGVRITIPLKVRNEIVWHINPEKAAEFIRRYGGSSGEI